MVRHCGRPPRRLGAGAAAHPRPGRPPPRGDPAARSFVLRPPSRSPAGLSSLPLPSSFAPSRPGAAATREPRRRSGAGPSREPRGVWDAGSGPRCPSLGPTRREQALGRGGGDGATARSLPGPHAGSIVSGRGPGSGVPGRRLPPPEAGASPSAPPGEGKTFPALFSLLRSGSSTPQVSRQFCLGRGNSPLLSPSPLATSRALGKWEFHWPVGGGYIYLF